MKRLTENLFSLMLAIVAVLVFCFAGPGIAANTTTRDQGTIVIVLDGSTDWTWNGDLSGEPAGGLIIYSIQFNTSAATDVLVVNNQSIDGVPIFKNPPASAVETFIKYYPPIGKRSRPIIDATDCTLDTPASALIIIEVEPW